MTLPSDWIKTNNLKKGDSVRVEYDLKEPNKLIIMIAP